MNRLRAHAKDIHLHMVAVCVRAHTQSHLVYNKGVDEIKCGEINSVDDTLIIFLKMDIYLLPHIIYKYQFQMYCRSK